MSDDTTPEHSSDDAPQADEPAAVETATLDEESTESSQSSSKKWKIAAIVAVIAAAVSLGALGSLLLGGGTQVAGDVLACQPSRDFTEGADPKAGDTCPPKDAKYTDGLVEKAKGGEFNIRTIEGGRLGEQLKLFVREPDRAYIDVQHAQTHAALGQPVRVYTKKHEGREIVIYMEDSPLLQ
jgi:hypothetical protein